MAKTRSAGEVMSRTMRLETSRFMCSDCHGTRASGDQLDLDLDLDLDLCH
jgi:hypothetical protein